MNIKAIALATMFTLTIGTTAHAAEAMECCKGDACCCRKAKDGGDAKQMDHSKMDHSKMNHSQPAPQPK